MVPETITSVAFILNETDEFITVASHISKHQVSGEMCIPKVAVISREALSGRGKGVKV
jgi:hypothetical protein